MLYQLSYSRVDRLSLRSFSVKVKPEFGSLVRLSVS